MTGEARAARGSSGGEAPRHSRRAHSRAVLVREGRRAQQFARFRPTELNLVPLVDTFVSIVFFALTAATVGELTPVARGVTLPTSNVGNAALQQLTLGVGPQGVTLGARPVMSAAELAALPSSPPGEGGAVEKLYAALQAAADSVRGRRELAPGAPVPIPLAIQGDRATQYAVLARVMQTARQAGFQQLTLQVERVEGARP